MAAPGRLGGKQRLHPVRAYRETPEVADATGRLVTALGKRVATEDTDGLQCLRALDVALAEAWAVAVAGLRASGYSDGAIGAELGVSRQAVEQRWPR